MSDQPSDDQCKIDEYSDIIQKRILEPIEKTKSLFGKDLKENG